MKVDKAYTDKDSAQTYTLTQTYSGSRSDLEERS